MKTPTTAALNPTQTRILREAVPSFSAATEALNNLRADLLDKAAALPDGHPAQTRMMESALETTRLLNALGREEKAVKALLVSDAGSKAA